MSFESRVSFWWVLLLCAFASAGAAVWLFPKALPLLQVQVDMSRDQALVAAQSLQAEQFPELATDRAVASFGRDDHLQNYMELEGGGVDAFTGLLGHRFIAPYQWTVRRFSESQEEEFRAFFTPEGRLYGFVRHVPEKALGAALPQLQARDIAVATARKWMGDALWADYAPLSASQVTRTGGRVDHTFVYEHRSERRAEARFRLNLVVAGDRLITMTPFAYVPEAFAQRFTSLRAGNDTIAKVAGIATFGLLGLGGVVGGWLWLARRGGLAWRSALACSAVVALMLSGAMVSNLPLSWMGYATTDSVHVFWTRQAVAGLVSVASTTLILGLVFAVAEGLNRRAFALHPRIFSFWSVAAAASPQALGRTVGGYAWMCLELLLVAGFYLVARTYFGWWVPADSMSDPNILASWRPALGPIANALQAGTMEEALFRAIPLAAAALIGSHFGWRRSAIAVALVIQALVFAGAHANYPGLPSYSRLVELFLPALLWGLVFIRYGLVPCIVMHFTFDLALMSMPIFVSTDSRLWLDRILVLLAGAMPLLMVLRARFKQGRFATLPIHLTNGEVDKNTPSGPSQIADVPLEFASPTHSVGADVARPWWLKRTALVGAACVGALAMALWSVKPHSTPVFTVDRSAAIARAENILSQQGVQLNADWKRLAIVRAVWEWDGQAVRFVWREAGPQKFYQLLDEGKIAPQQWRVMFRNTGGPVDERAESWEVVLDGQGEVLAVFHSLPEGRPGAKLDRAQAQAMVKEYMAGHKALANRPWQEAAVQEIERPARRDWAFSFDDKSALDVKGGTVRVTVNVRGDALDAWQYVFVPDAWLREQAQKESEKTAFNIVKRIASVGLALLLLGAALRGVVKAKLRWRQGLVWGALCVVALAFHQGMTFDRTAMGFAVTQPWDTQVATGFALVLLGAVAVSALLGMLVMAIYQPQRPSTATVGRELFSGLAIAVLLEGVSLGLKSVFPKDAPDLTSAKLLESLWPWADTAMQSVFRMCLIVGLIVAVRAAVALAGSLRGKMGMLLLVALFAVGEVFSADQAMQGLANVLALAIPVAVLLALLARAEVGIAIAAVAWSSVIDLPSALAIPVSGAAGHALLAILSMALMTGWALRYGRSLGSDRA